MIVKVQISLNHPAGQRRVLIYNEHRDWQYEDAIEENDPLLKQMKGEPKAFFHAMPVKKGRKGTFMNRSGKPKMNYELAIGSRAPWQSW